MIFHDFDGLPFSIAEGSISELRVVFIDISSSKSSFSSKEAVLEKLNKAGVDSNNYEETIAYLNENL